MLESGPNIICQICESSGHSAVSCPFRYQPKLASNIPTMATFSSVEAAESLLVLDSAATAHMTLEEGILSSTIPYGFEKIIVGNNSLLPVANIGSFTIKTHSKHLLLYSVVRCSFSVKDNSTGHILLEAPSTGNVYSISLNPPPKSTSAFLTLDSSGNAWHR